MGVLLHHCLHERLDELIVFVSANSFVTPTEIQGISQQLFVVGPYVQHDWQGRSRMNSRAECVKRELADRDAHAADAQIAKAENALAVGYDHDLDGFVRRIIEQAANFIAIWIRDVQTARSAEYVTVKPAAFPDCGRVDDGHHLGDVLLQQSVKERLITILKRGEKDISLEVVALALVVSVNPEQMLVER